MTRANPTGPGRGRPPKPKAERKIQIRGWLSPESMEKLESAVALAGLERGSKAATEISEMLATARKRHGAQP